MLIYFLQRKLTLDCFIMHNIETRVIFLNFLYKGTYHGCLFYYTNF